MRLSGATWSCVLVIVVIVMTHVVWSSSSLRRSSGRLLAQSDPVKCARRPRQLLDRDTGHYYFFSQDASFRGNEAAWLDARNLCRERCMDLVSLESFMEHSMLAEMIVKRDIRHVWTSGRLCNFKGCDQPHLKPPHINGWFWAASGEQLAATNATPAGWPSNPWSPTGFIGQFLEVDVAQPDNAEYLLNPSLATTEACLAVLNNWYEDGVRWHDAACYRKKAFVCEDNDNLIKRARSRSPRILIP